LFGVVKKKNGSCVRNTHRQGGRDRGKKKKEGRRKRVFGDERGRPTQK